MLLLSTVLAQGKAHIHMSGWSGFNIMLLVMISVQPGRAGSYLHFSTGQAVPQI